MWLIEGVLGYPHPHGMEVVAAVAIRWLLEGVNGLPSFSA